MPWWLLIVIAILPAAITLTGMILSTRTQRRSSREANRINEKSAAAALKSANAASESATISEHAAKQADQAAAQLNSFRLHDDTMKTLYWAADHAILPDAAHALLGLEVLGALVTQVEDDSDHRGGRLVRATSEAVTTVAIPTFVSVLTKAAHSDSEGQGAMTVAAVEINAAKLLVAHGPNLTPELRGELEMIASTEIGSGVPVTVLHAAHHLDHQVEHAHQRELSRELTHEHEIGL